MTQRHVAQCAYKQDWGAFWLKRVLLFTCLHLTVCGRLAAQVAGVCSLPGGDPGPR